MAINAVNILPGDNKRELDKHYPAEVFGERLVIPLNLISQSAIFKVIILVHKILWTLKVCINTSDT